MTLAFTISAILTLVMGVACLCCRPLRTTAVAVVSGARGN